MDGTTHSLAAHHAARSWLHSLNLDRRAKRGPDGRRDRKISSFDSLFRANDLANGADGIDNGSAGRIGLKPNEGLERSSTIRTGREGHDVR